MNSNCIDFITLMSLLLLIGSLFEVAHSDEGTTLGINPGGPIDCPNPQPKCPQNQIYSLCGRLCEPSCENPHLFCPRIACTKKRAGCRCSVGFLRRASDDACVKADDCCKPSPHDVYSNSSDWCCESTCKSDDPCNGTDTCPSEAGCVCAPGFKRAGVVGFNACVRLCPGFTGP